MGQDFSKYLINFIIILLAFFLVETEPMMSIILLGVAAFLLFFLYSRHAIIIYALYFALEETILLHIPAQFIVIMKYLGDILILSIFLATFAKLAMRRYVLSSFQTGPMHIPLFLFLITALISAILNQIPPLIALVAVRQLLRYVVLFYAIIITSEAEWLQSDLKKLVKIILALVVIQVFIGYFQILLGSGSELNKFLSQGNFATLDGVPIVISWKELAFGKRLFGTMVNPNTYGLFLSLGFCLILGIYLTPKEKAPPNHLLLLLLRIVVFPLLKSHSRQSIYATLVGGIIIGWILKDRRTLFISSAIILAFSVYVSQTKEPTEWTASQQTLTQRIASPFQPGYHKFAQGSDRIYAINNYTPKILDSRYVFFGVGPGAIGTGFGFARQYVEGFKKLGIPSYEFNLAHTGISDIGFLSILTQYGVIGFFAFFSIFIVLFHTIFTKLLPEISDPLYKGITVGLLGYIAALLISNIGYSNFTIRQISYYFWALAAIICSIRRFYRHERTETP